MNVDIIANTIFGTQYDYTDINFIDCNLDGGIIKEESTNICPCCGRKKMVYTKSKNSRKVSLSFLLSEVSEFKDCGEIYNFLKNIEEEQENHFPEEVTGELKELMKKERLYGSMIDSGIRLLKKYISENE